MGKSDITYGLKLLVLLAAAVIDVVLTVEPARPELLKENIGDDHFTVR